MNSQLLVPLRRTQIDEVESFLKTKAKIQNLQICSLVTYYNKPAGTIYFKYSPCILISILISSRSVSSFTHVPICVAFSPKPSPRWARPAS